MKRKAFIFATMPHCRILTVEDDPAIRRGIVEIGQDSAAADFGRSHQSLPAEPLPRPYAADTE